VTVVIEVDRLSKRFGPVTAVDDLSFTVRPGHVTGFLGPNGAGKIGRFTLLDAGGQVTALHPAADLFSPGASLLVLLAWPAAALAAAAVLITRRDA